ncbi:hypothetical protein HBA55_00570 [Pseudomaricurvus alkylphenolicus]|uniref:hypothetical protein n=1 Tax=Pseudomaricurvus alkylphenolicus TaxID=1306991 RepID=UPI00141F555C|nr:hypothetical protein [Pseudomaricurvus alkylphenolicus]NIB38053.1 hypothetical protein [Pseudomaricurvus alkylphenolicus]
MKDILQSYLFRVILIPPCVFLAVMFGGGAASGLETVTYMSSSGPLAGLLAIGIIALIVGTVIFLVYELGRLHRAYDYKAFGKTILGDKGAPLYEIFITLSMFLTLAYAATAGGTAVANHFDLPRFGVTIALLSMVVFLTYQGRRIVEMSMVGTSVMLLLCLLSMALTSVFAHGEAVASSLQDNLVDVTAMLGNLAIYTVAIIAYVPVMLYTARDLRSRQETLVAGYISGFVYVTPILCMHLSYLSRYPQALQQDIPNRWIAAEIMPPAFSDIFVAVLFIAILQTGVGLLQGFLERLDNWSLAKRNRRLSRKAHAGFSAAILTACLSLSSVGVIALLAKVFAFGFWLSLFIFTIPLFTVGVYKVFFGQAFARLGSDQPI